MMYYYNSFFPFHVMGFVGMVLFWGAVIFGIMFLLKKTNLLHGASEGRALDILKERYAKGEMTKEQFESMKKDIQ